MKSETLEHALAEAIAKRLTDGHAWALQCRVLAYEAAREGFRLGVATSAQLTFVCWTQRTWVPRGAAWMESGHSGQRGRVRLCTTRAAPDQVGS